MGGRQGVWGLVSGGFGVLWLVLGAGFPHPAGALCWASLPPLPGAGVGSMSLTRPTMRTQEC